MDVKMQMELLELKAKVEVLRRFRNDENYSMRVEVLDMIMGWGPDAKDEEIAMLREELQNAINDAPVKEAEA